MGCGGSKVDDLPLVNLCRERKEFIRAASHYRYAFAAAHVAYFQSLSDTGEAIRKFVDEELIIGPDSSPGSPILTLPSEGKSRKSRGKSKNSSSSTSIDSNHHRIEEEDEECEFEGSHLHISDSDTDLDSEPGSPSGHILIDERSPIEEVYTQTSAPPNYYYPYMNPLYPPQQGYPQGYSPGYQQGYGWEPPVSNPNQYMYYMKKSATPAQSVLYDPNTNSYAYPGNYGNGGYFGYPMGSSSQEPNGYRQPSPERPPPAPPSPPSVSTWDFLNVFANYDNSAAGAYESYGYPRGKFGYPIPSNTSSPDSHEVREREGIPDLEEETEQEVLKETQRQKRKSYQEAMLDKKKKNINGDLGEGTSRSVPFQKGIDEITEKKNATSPDDGYIPDTIISHSSEEEYTGKKGVSFEVEETKEDIGIGSPMPSSLTTLSAHGTRDLREVVKEINAEFEIASSYGKEVALLLEVGKLPYQHKSHMFRVIFSRILYLAAPSAHTSPTMPSLQLSSRTVRMTKAYCGETENDFDTKLGSLSSTLEKLYVWEKKLYKEVKDEERLRITYEKKCKKLKALDDKGAETSKIDATRTSIRKLLTKINVCIRAVDAISTRIHILRDEELQPQLSELVQRLIKMWRCMLKCHQKQFRAIMECKIRSPKSKTGFRRYSGMKATLDLELELLNWCRRFNNWINTQKSYVDSLNEWLKRCLHYKPEETSDGIPPFSPSRIGAPAIFIFCNDWSQAVNRISENGVTNSMVEFASSLHHLWERLDDEQRQKIKSDYLSKDFEKQLRTLRLEREKMKPESEKTAMSKISYESGVSPLDDLKVDLDSMRNKLDEEKKGHKEKVKLVDAAASSSLQAGLIPIFEALKSFTSDITNAHEQIRLEIQENCPDDIHPHSQYEDPNQ